MKPEPIPERNVYPTATENMARSAPSAASSDVDMAAVSARIAVANGVVNDPMDLQRSLESLRAAPCKTSRSYLVPFAEHLMEMKAKGFTFRDMRAWFKENHKRQPSLSTLHHFFASVQKKARQARSGRKAHEALAAPKISVPPASKFEAAVGDNSNRNQQAREAIRAAKKRANTVEMNTEPKPFTFDEHEPLITNPKTEHQQ